MTAILGISAFYHDSAAALLVDGEVVAAAQEERFTRKKHDHEFPQHAIDYCLREAGIEPEQLDYVGFYDKPWLKFERLLETYLAFAPRGFRLVPDMAMPLWLNGRSCTSRARSGKGIGTTGYQIASSSSPSTTSRTRRVRSSRRPFEEAAIMTLDGVGEWATASWGVGPRQQAFRAHARAPLPPFARPALFRVHLLLRASRSTRVNTS